MSDVTGVGANNNAYVTQAAVQNAKAEQAKSEAAIAEEVAEEVSGASTEAKKTDGFSKTSTQYKPDMDKVNELKSDMSKNIGAFKAMVQSLVQKQGGQVDMANGFSLKNFFQSLNVDEATRTAAQEAISEDGEWGVKATSERILEFAKAISGGDPDKIDLLRNAVDAGFKAAERAWGGTLPSISQQTYDAVMKGFDDWAENGAYPDTAAAAAVTATQ